MPPALDVTMFIQLRHPRSWAPALVLALGVALSALMATTLMSAPAMAEDREPGPGGPPAHHDGPGGPDGPGGHGGMGGPGGMFKNADTNNDGFLTRTEMEDAHKKRLDTMFKELDTNSDSKLSQDEMKAGREKMRDRMRERMKERKEHGDDRGGDMMPPPPEDDRP